MAIEPSTAFFTADPHIGDRKMCGPKNVANRPWPTTESMFEGLVAAWNAVVPTGGVVYVLGDVFGNGKPDIEGVRRFLAATNGSKHLIYGNHDENVQSEVCRCLGFQSTAVRRTVMVKDVEGNRENRLQEIVLDHYPLRSWKNRRDGAWHLYGHVHGQAVPYGKSVDVGVDAWNYTPVSYLSLKEFFKGKCSPSSPLS